jgi:hypothetical protein
MNQYAESGRKLIMSVEEILRLGFRTVTLLGVYTMSPR